MNRFNVFISSTMRDMAELRERLANTIDSLEIFTAVRAESLPATADSSRNVCLSEVSASDVVVLIVGKLYGYVPEENNPERLSVTHLEYRRAIKDKKPVLAFVLESADSDPAVKGFISELEDFDSGLFRRKFKKEDELSALIRTAVLWWVARLSRGQKTPPIDSGVFRQQLGREHIGELSLRLSFPALNSAPREWIEGAISLVNSDVERDYLPTLAIVEDGDAGDIEIRTTSQADTNVIELTIALAEHISQMAAGLHLWLPQTIAGQNLLADALRSFAFLASEDFARFVTVLHSHSESKETDPRNQEQILNLLMNQSVIYDSQRTPHFAEEILALEGVHPTTLRNASFAMLGLLTRFNRHQFPIANRRLRELQVELLQKAIQLQGRPEDLYGLARYALELNLPGSVELVLSLAEMHPDYEARWYWNRDLGVHFYQVGNLQLAAKYYDTASTLKPSFSELFRYAGDAYYYQGDWAEALVRYNKALALESAEIYLLDMKCAYATAHISTSRSNWFLTRKRLAARLSGAGTRVDSFSKLLSRICFWCARHTFELDSEASRAAALTANRKGDYRKAVKLLVQCLSGVPEDFSARLNLFLNLLILNKGEFNAEISHHLRAAIFNGGPETRDRLEIRLVNTSQREQILSTYDELFEEVKKEYDGYRERRAEILKPEKFGLSTHVEFR